MNPRGVDVLNQAIDASGGIQPFASMLDVSIFSVYAWRRGERWLHSKVALRIEDRCGVPAENLMFFDKEALRLRTPGG